jgi:hypothetical protein
VVLDQEARVKAELLGLDVEVEIIAEALPCLGRQTLAAGLR